MNSSANKIPFGFKDGKLVSVNDVESGLSCGCFCPSCNGRLQANKGKIYTNYFSHDPSEDTRECKSAFETSIHRMAKEILSEELYTVFPELLLQVSKTDVRGEVHTEEKTIENEAIVRFNKVELEKRIEDIQPDIIAYTNKEEFLIEIYVTHQVDDKKKKIIRNLGLPAVEIDLSSVSYQTTKEELKVLITSPSSKRIWLSNPKAINIKKNLEKILDEKINSINAEHAKRRAKYESERKKWLAKKTVEKSPVKKHGNSGSNRTFVKEYDPRWFVCKNCLTNRNSYKNPDLEVAFNVPLKDAPYNLHSIKCPYCNYELSIK